MVLFKPYVVYGTVRDWDTDAPSVGVSVKLRNETSGEETQPTITDSNGRFRLDCANFASGYSEGDMIQVIIVASGSLGQDLRFKTICYEQQAQIEELTVKYTVT